MKKKIIIIILLVFAFIPVINAANVTSIDTTVTIDGEGRGLVTEVWTMPEEINTKTITKNFYQAKGINISDISVTDKANTTYNKVDSLKNDDTNAYAYTDKGYKKNIKFTANGKENSYTLKYTVDGIISKFKDGFGVNMFFYVPVTGYHIDSYKLTINSSGTPFTDQNTKIYANGNNIKVGFLGESVRVEAENLGRSNKLFVVTLSSINYTNYREVKYTAQELNKRNGSKLLIIDEMMSVVTSRTSLVIIGVFLLIVIILIIRSIIRKVRGFDQYFGIESQITKEVPQVNNVNYFDSIPCGGNLYKIAFIGGYYKIFKNRSNLIGAFLLKWIYDGNVRIVKDNSLKYLKIVGGDNIDAPLDRDLFSFVTDASNYHQLDGMRLNRYASDHYMRVMTWFNMCVSQEIIDEENKGRIKKVKKLKHYSKIMDESIYEDAVKIQGLKRYLLNFNQVPRQSELTPELYQYMLVVAELLGIGEAFAREILRKNPNNEMAIQLLDLENMNYLYKGVFNYAFGPYKQIVKKSKMTYSFNPNEVINKETNTEERTSRL